MTIQEIAAEVAEKRQKFQELSESWEAEEQKFQEEHSATFNAVLDARDAMRIAEAKLRAAALATPDRWKMRLPRHRLALGANTKTGRT